MSDVERVKSMNGSEWIVDKDISQNSVSFFDLHIKKGKI